MTAYYPTSTLGFQFIKEDGSPAKDHYLKYYEANTDTPLSVGFNSTGVADDGVTELLVDKVKTNTLGQAINSTGAAVNPHASQAWRFCLFPTATDADNNNFAVALIDIPKVVPGPLDVIPSTAVTSSSSINHTSGSSSDTILVGDLLNWMAVTVRSFNDEAADGTTNATTAITNALAYSGHVIFTPGIYLCGGVNVITDHRSVHFIGDVTLKANANNLTMFKQTSSYCTHHGTFRVDSNSFSSIYGMAIGPTDLTDTTTVSNQIGNALPGIILDNSCTEGVIFQCGPDVSGTDSICKGNVVPQIVANGARRALWFKDAANAGATVPTRNSVMGIIDGTATTTNTNTLAQIDAGQYNEIHKLHAEDVTSGSTPNATPTALKIVSACPTTSVSNDHNKVFGGSIVNATRHIDNANSTTKTYGLTYTSGSSVLGSITSV